MKRHTPSKVLNSRAAHGHDKKHGIDNPLPPPKEGEESLESAELPGPPPSASSAATKLGISESTRRRASLLPVKTALKRSSFVASLLQLDHVHDKAHLFEVLSSKAKGGRVDFEGFQEALTVAGLDDELLVRQMFLAFSPTVELADAEEKLHGLMDGTMEDATGFAFEVYDTNKDGYVDADEFASVLQATVKQKERRQSSVPKEMGALKAAASGAAGGGNDDDEDGLHDGNDMVNNLWISQMTETIFKHAQEVLGKKKLTKTDFEAVIYETFDKGTK